MDLINSPWSPFDNSKDVNCAWTAWSNVFLGVIDKHFPCRTIRVQNKPSPWLNSNIKQLIFQRVWLKKKAVRTGTLEDWTAYRFLRNSVNKEIRLAKKSFYQTKINQVSGDQNATWKLLNDLLEKKSKFIRFLSFIANFF